MPPASPVLSAPACCLGAVVSRLAPLVERTRRLSIGAAGRLRCSERGARCLGAHVRRSTTAVLCSSAARGSARRVTIIVFDLETSGFLHANARIIEIAARDLAGGPYSTMVTLVNPDLVVTNTHVHNIRSSDVNRPSVPRWDVVARALVAFVNFRQVGDAPVVLAAHNAKTFDVPFLVQECRRVGVDIPSSGLFLDTFSLAREALRSGKSQPKKAGLMELYSHYKLPAAGTPHRAKADVDMLVRVLQKLMEDLELNVPSILPRTFRLHDLKGSRAAMQASDALRNLPSRRVIHDHKAEHVDDQQASEDLKHQSLEDRNKKESQLPMSAH
eukprot:SM000017S02771  [mRNA]  locus=s17:117648:119531:- [translate_table: standard]